MGNGNQMKKYLRNVIHCQTKDLNKYSKYIKTSLYFIETLFYGVLSSSFYSTILDLKELTNSDLNQMGFGQTNRYIGGIISSLLVPFVYDRRNRDLVYGISALIFGAASILIGSTTSIVFHQILNMIIGMTIASFETGGMLTMAKLWQNRIGTIVMLMCFIITLGGALSPILYSPFLSSDANTESPYRNKSGTTVYKFNDTSNLDKLIYDTDKNVSIADDVTVYQPGRVYIPYTVNGLALISGGLAIIIFLLITTYIAFKKTSDYNVITSSNVNEDEDKKFFSNDRIENFYKLLTTIIHLICVVIYVNSFLFSQLVLPFLIHSDIHASKEIGLKMLTGGLFSFMAGNLLGTVLSLRIQPIITIFLMVLLEIIFNVIILTFGRWSLLGNWIGICGYNLFLGPFYGAIYASLQQQVGITAIICGLVSATFNLPGTIGVPVLMTNYVEKKPYLLIYYNLICFILLGVGAVFIVIMGRLIKNRETMRNENFNHEIEFK